MRTREKQANQHAKHLLDNAIVQDDAACDAPDDDDLENKRQPAPGGAPHPIKKPAANRVDLRVNAYILDGGDHVDNLRQGSQSRADDDENINSIHKTSL